MNPYVQDRPFVNTKFNNIFFFEIAWLVMTNFNDIAGLGGSLCHFRATAQICLSSVFRYVRAYFFYDVENEIFQRLIIFCFQKVFYLLQINFYAFTPDTHSYKINTLVYTATTKTNCSRTYNQQLMNDCYFILHTSWTWHWKVRVSFFAIYIHSNEIHNVAALIVYWCSGVSSTCFGP